MSTSSNAVAPASGEFRLTPQLSVLVVEDNEADAYLIRRALFDQPDVGLVVIAQDGVEALRMVDEGEVTPDLAFIDLNMPRKDGFGLLADFADRKHANFPKVVLTSSSAPVDAMRSRMRGAVRVFSKPDSYLALKARVRREVRRAISNIWSS